MARLVIEAVNQMKRPEAKAYFDGWACDLSARKIIVDFAISIYEGQGNTDVNAAVASLMHAADYLEDRIGYEMDPHPKGMIRLPIEESEAGA